MQHERGGDSCRARRVGRAAGLPACGLLRCRSRGALQLPLLDVGGRRRGAAVRQLGRHPGLGPEPHRTGDRVRLLLRPRGQDLPVARPRGGHGQLQPGDRLDGLRHVRPPLLRTARRGGGARDLRARAAARRRHPVRRADTVEARKSARGRRLRDPRNAVRRGRPRRGPRALCRPLRRARNRRPALGSRCGSGGRDRDRGGDRVPGPRPSVLRPRRAQHAGLLRPGGGRSGGRGRRVAFSSTGSSRGRSRSTSMRSATARKPLLQP